MNKIIEFDGKTDNLPVGNNDHRVSTSIARVQKEIEGQIILAKKYPRNATTAYTSIISSCKRISFAEKALYAYPKGGMVVEGPGIRLAEVISMYWGNIDYGFRVLESDHNRSIVEAYAWDMETNARKKIEFEVSHKIDTKRGVKHLTSERDIYEHVANYASRRMRNCVLALVPVDIKDSAVEACKKTISEGFHGEDRKDKVNAMAVAFDEIGVTVEQLTKYLGIHKIEGAAPSQLAKLRSIYTSIKEGAAEIGSFFELPPATDILQKLNEESLIEKLRIDVNKVLETIRMKEIDIVPLVGKGYKDLDKKIMDASSISELNAMKSILVEIDNKK